jgi:PAS domain S-box-containing protein
MRPDDVVPLLDHLTDGVFVFDEGWAFSYINEPGAQMLGRPREQLLGAHAWTEFPEAVGGPSYTAYHQARREGVPVRVTELYEPLGREFEVRAFPAGEDLVVVFRDITDIHRVADELREYADRMSAAEKIARFGVWKWDLAADTVVWSAELHRLYGVVPGEFGGTVDDFVARLHPDDRDRVWAHVREAVETLEPFVFEERILWPDGTVRHLLSQGRATPGPDGTAAALVGVCHDITERVQAERELGLSERRLRAIVDNTPSVIAVKDLEGRYLMANAETGRVLGTTADELIGRHCTELFAPEVAQQLRANDHVAAAEGRPVFDETVLMGVDGEPRTYVTVTFALPDADGRPAEICTIGTDVTDRRHLEDERRERLAWRERIGGAIDEGRMLVYAQPIVELAGGEVASRELLVRMRPADPADELQLPGAFLPAAERFGLVQPIDVWVVGQALGLAVTRRVAVNLSAVSLCDAAARREIVALLGSEPAAAANITFEITETAALEHLDAATSFAEDIGKLGCGLALDDFGTGFGSFTYLRSLPLRYLKIDLSFVAGIRSSTDDRRVVQCIISIAREFGLQTIAEGIETTDQQNFVTALGCDLGQGYLFSRPIDADEAVIVLAGGRVTAG